MSAFYILQMMVLKFVSTTSTTKELIFLKFYNQFQIFCVTELISRTKLITICVPLLKRVEIVVWYQCFLTNSTDFVYPFLLVVENTCSERKINQFLRDLHNQCSEILPVIMIEPKLINHCKGHRDVSITSMRII